MTELDQRYKKRKNKMERSTATIREDISKGAEEISQKFGEIENRIQEKIDWRGYVKDHPGWTLAAAAGVGYLASGLLNRRATPLQQILRSFNGVDRDSLGRMISGNKKPGILGLTLISIAASTAVEWIGHATSKVMEDDNGSEDQATTAFGSDIGPEISSDKIQSENDKFNI